MAPTRHILFITHWLVILRNIVATVHRHFPHHFILSGETEVETQEHQETVTVFQVNDLQMESKNNTNMTVDQINVRFCIVIYFSLLFLPSFCFPVSFFSLIPSPSFNSFSLLLFPNFLPPLFLPLLFFLHFSFSLFSFSLFFLPSYAWSDSTITQVTYNDWKVYGGTTSHTVSIMVTPTVLVR